MVVHSSLRKTHIRAVQHHLPYVITPAPDTGVRTLPSGPDYGPPGPQVDSDRTFSFIIMCNIDFALFLFVLNLLCLNNKA